MNGGRRGNPAIGRASRAARSVATLPLVGAMLIFLIWPRAQTQEGEPDLGSLVTCANDTPQLVIVVPDVSSSVIDSNGADPSGRSFQEAILVAKLMRDTPCSSDDRFGAVIFANKAVEVPPIPVSSHSLLAATLTRPPESEIGSGTRIGPAIDRALTMASRFPEHKTTIILLSDMQTEEDLTTQLIATETTRFSLVALGASRDASYDDFFDSVVPIRQVSRGSVGMSIVQAINQARARTS